MKDWWRRLRGAVGLGITWALGWAPIGAGLGSVLWFLLDPPGSILTGIARNAAVFGALGFAGGMAFSTVLRLTEGKRRFDELSLPRFAVWGAAGGLFLGGSAVALGLWGASGISALGVAVTAAATLLGAGSATGSLALARQSEDQELLEAADDVLSRLPVPSESS